MIGDSTVTSTTGNMYDRHSQHSGSSATPPSNVYNPQVHLVSAAAPVMPPTPPSEPNAIMNNVSHGKTDHSGDKYVYALSPGRYAAVSLYRGKVLIHVRDYVIDIISGKMYATKRGIAMKVNKWEKLKENMYQIDAAVTAILQQQQKQ